MKNQPLSALLIFTVLCTLSCEMRNSSREEKQQPEVPEALQESSYYDLTSSKRGYDLVNKLYYGEVERDSALRTLDEKIAVLFDGRSDSTGKYYNYNEKSNSYYSTANQMMTGVKDSVLKNKLMSLITASSAAYKSKISAHENWIKTIDEKNVSLHDLYTVLKITRTLPLMEDYQKNNLPDQASLKSYTVKQDEVSKELKEIIK